MIVAGTLTNKMAPALRKVLVDAMVQVVKKCFDFLSFRIFKNTCIHMNCIHFSISK